MRADGGDPCLSFVSSPPRKRGSITLLDARLRGHDGKLKGGWSRPSLTTAALASALVLVAAGPVGAAPHELAVLQGLDKVTARISTIEAPVGDVVRFGTLEIIARVCDKRPPEETPESAAFLDIWEVRRGEPPTSVFRGWMFASSPALSALEHPVYDVWVLDCRNKASMPSAPRPR